MKELKANPVELVVKLYFQGVPLEQAIQRSNIDIKAFRKLVIKNKTE